MRFILEIDCDNDAFSADAATQEVARMLKATGKYLERCNPPASDEISLRDSNGNTVGRAYFVR